MIGAMVYWSFTILVVLGFILSKIGVLQIVESVPLKDRSDNYIKVVFVSVLLLMAMTMWRIVTVEEPHRIALAAVMAIWAAHIAQRYFNEWKRRRILKGKT